MKRSKPMKRTGFGPRRTRVNPYRKKARRSARVRDVAYLALVRQQPCCAAYLGGCEGPIEADHVGRRGLGQKCSDYETIALCRLHHRQRTDFSGPFKTWRSFEMAAFLESKCRGTQHQLGAPQQEAA